MTTTRSIAAVAAFLLASASMSAFAHGGGNGGGNGGGMGGGMGGGIGASVGHAGGMSAGHMSSKGLANTNSTIAADRDKGRARASDRAGLHAQSHLSKHSKHGKHVAVGQQT